MNRKDITARDKKGLLPQAMKTKRVKTVGVEYAGLDLPARHEDKKLLASLNLRLPEEFLQQLKAVSQGRNVKTTTLARKLLREGLEKIRQEELGQKLVKSYKYLAKEDAQLLDEFSEIDLEGWGKE